MRVYQEVGYDGMMMPDHVPRVEGVGSDLAARTHSPSRPAPVPALVTS